MGRTATRHLRIAGDLSLRAAPGVVVASRRGWDEPVLTIGPPGADVLAELVDRGSLTDDELAVILPQPGQAEAVVAALEQAALVVWEGLGNG